MVRTRQLTDADVTLICDQVRATITGTVITACQEADGIMPPAQLDVMRIAALTVVALDRLDHLREVMRDLSAMVGDVNEDIMELTERLDALAHVKTLQVYQ